LLLEQNLIKQALTECHGVVAQAARKLQLNRTTLVEKMRKYGLDKTSEDTESL
jgi:sigma-54 specific flagellar transcriptional regulator A